MSLLHRQQHHQKQQEGEDEDGSVLSGFSKHFLAQSFGINEDIAEKLQSPDDGKNNNNKRKTKTKKMSQDPVEKGDMETGLRKISLQENIARPSRAHFYNPNAGRVITLPALRQFGLSAQYVVLFKRMQSANTAYK
ncbi:hypothetical protein JHK85_027464 [Glycine max]|nr:hypothetical protein JHK85_027464 [Glycine max]KAG5002825.1 hypothetical protein JHK86_026964 [Glycine max]